MDRSPSNPEVEVTLKADFTQQSAVPLKDEPFRILILGDFSGRTNRIEYDGRCQESDFSPVLVDRDNLDQVIGQLSIQLHLPGLEKTRPSLSIQFGELEDFHPDRIIQRIEFFQHLMTLRRQLGDPSTFAQAAAEVRRWTKRESDSRTTEESENPAGPSSANSGQLPANELLDQILEEGAGTKQVVPDVGDQKSWEHYMQEIVAPYSIPKEDPEATQLMDQVNAVIGMQMLALLHHPDYQALEAIWRGLHFLTSRLETGTTLKLYVLDLSKAELAVDLKTGEEVSLSKLYRLLVNQAVGTPGAEKWAVIAGNYTINRSQEDIEFLGRLARVAKDAGAAFLTGASPQVVGCESMAETPDPNDWQDPRSLINHELWEALRKRPEASYLGLALPRFLLRLPYGSDTDPLETFEFEEMPESSRHENYLWGNPIFACLYLIGKAYSEEGWALRLGTFQEVDSLPLYVYRQDGESRIKPCAESLLSDRTAESILDTGLMPLLWVKNHDSIRLPRFQSVARPLRALSGPWMG